LVHIARVIAAEDCTMSGRVADMGEAHFVREGFEQLKNSIAEESEGARAIRAEAVSYFKEGYNCAQSVLLTMQKFWNVEKPLEPKVASAFGGGIGRRGSLCGALTGGVIAIGSKYGSNNPVVEERENAYSLALEFYNRFTKECGSVLCRDLIGYDLTDPEELEKARNSNVSMEKCVHFVEKAVEILTNFETTTHE
jgi:C_GCAxxG_C_C family probable redox protein